MNKKGMAVITTLISGVAIVGTKLIKKKLKKGQNNENASLSNFLGKYVSEDGNDTITLKEKSNKLFISRANSKTDHVLTFNADYEVSKDFIFLFSESGCGPNIKITIKSPEEYELRMISIDRNVTVSIYKKVE